MVGQPMPDVDVLLQDGSCRSVNELLRGRCFLLLDLEGVSRQFDAMDLGALPVNLAMARLAKAPAALDGLTAVLVRPDGYVAWASAEEAGSVDAMRGLENELARWLKRN
jgi:hypothetical protein